MKRTHHARELDRLKAMIPPECPIIVHYNAEPDVRAFVVRDIVTQEIKECGRYQVAYAFIDGYVRGWLTCHDTGGQS